MKASVIIPAFKQADFLGAAIESVLNQTYKNLEVVVVNDASPDHTEQVAQSYSDPRLIYVRHEVNSGLPATRNTGIKASNGEVVFLLDCDDYFHPEKVQRHIEFLQQNPDVGCTYNPRFEMYYSGETINGLVRPPMTVALPDLVQGFPFTPSDMVIRRSWLDQVGGFDGSLRNYSEDLDINCKLALAGCKFANVNRALNYRRLHSARPLRVAARLDAALQVLERILTDPRCPEEVRALRNRAYRINYVVWADVALLQNDLEIGQDYLRKALKHDPSILKGNPCELTNYFAWSAACDDNFDHADMLKVYFDNLPAEMAQIRPQYDWALGRGSLLRAVRAMTWNRPEEGRRHFAEAAKHNAAIDEGLLRKFADELFNYEFEFGAEKAQVVWQRVNEGFQLFNRDIAKQLRSIYFINRAFKYLHNGKMKQARQLALEAIAHDPRHLTNRGVLAMLLRTVIGARPADVPQFMQPVGN